MFLKISSRPPSPEPSPLMLNNRPPLQWCQVALVSRKLYTGIEIADSTCDLLPQQL